MFGLTHPDIVLIGEGDRDAGQFLEDFYVRFCENKPIVHRLSIESAEIAKIALNCFLTTKIAFAYELI
jgi:UDP-glucose 6-dehydrogenase